MKKIILLEDRPIRQQLFTNDLEISLEEFKVLENVCGGDKFDKAKMSISLEKIHEFNSYSVIIVHRSALSQSERLLLIEYVKTNSKILVLFSGGISSSIVQKLGEGKLLTINSKDLYSKSLLLFLKNSGEEILELAFGENWKINVLAETHEKLCFYKHNYSNKPISVMKSDLDLNQWIIDEYIKDKTGLFSSENLQSLIDEIGNKIKELLQ